MLQKRESTKKEKEETKQEKKKIEKVQEKPVVKEEPVAEEELPPVIENIKAEKIEGPRILGKIDLPVNNDTRPVKDEKRKRKRIPIEKKEVRPDTNQHQNRGGGDRRPGGPGGGGGGFNRGGGGDQRGRTGGTGGGGRRPITIRREDKLIDEKAIQEKIRETQAKLSGGGGKGKGLKQKCAGRKDRD